METLNDQTLQQLVATEDFNSTAITLLAPMEKAGKQVQKNEIYWKNVVRDAEQQLSDAKVDQELIDQLLDPARGKLGDNEFWQHQQHGLAYFASESGGRLFQLDTEIDPLAFVGDRFMVGPVVDAVVNSRVCYILACSPKRVRLLRVTGNEIDDLQPDNFPDNLRDALNIDEYVSALQQHSTSRSGNAGGSDAVFHGHGGSDPDIKKKDELLQYFHKLDDCLDDYFGQENNPLVFAGVEYLFPLIKEALSYKHLLDQTIDGNPDDLTPEQLLERAQPILDQMKSQRQQRAVEAVKEKLHTDWASDELDDIRKAAELGQVETLVLSHDADLVACNQAVADSLRYNGQVEILPEEHQHLDGSNAAALFRSPAGKFLDTLSNTNNQ